MEPYVIGTSSLQPDCPVEPGSGFEREKKKMGVTVCLDMLIAYVCGEEHSTKRYGWKKMMIIFLTIGGGISVKTTPPIGRNFHTQVFNSGRSVVSQSSPSIILRRHEPHRQPSAPAVKSGRAEQKSLWTSRWKRDRKRVTDDDSEQPGRPLFQVYMSNCRINCSFAHFCLIDYLAHTSPGPSAFRFGSKSKKRAPEDDSVRCQRLPFADPMMRTLRGISRIKEHGPHDNPFVQSLSLSTTH
ncbi:hypothetical protein MJO28_002437 [Puccinia striiformis f. sp. tritici]|uniref:Uncharacterized protein n=2 Tax=Puccinia striiformis TaxID=27350 RepID=A0A2S4UWE0_9BASI|nr:hypothetical protein MJO28_002437 [Puccinia striiformis f. sp. tritici]POW01592.1 hypothetical protein PSTT_12358 [Puccinia striiformis]